MKNNKGFTLVELLAVILILLGLAGVTLFGITSILSKRDADELEEQKELVCGAAKIYFSLNPPTGSTGSVTIRDLKEGEYFNSTSKLDKVEMSWAIVIQSGNKKMTINGEPCPAQ